MSNPNQLPNAKLEAYFMVPLQLQLTDRSEEKVDHKRFYRTLLANDWDDVIEHELDNIGAGSKPKDNERNLNHYFHPFVQNFWFENKQNRDSSLVRRFRHKCLNCLSIVPCHSANDKAIEFEAACDLLHFQPDILMLCLHVRSCEIISYANMLDCLNELRRLYPSSFMMDEQNNVQVSGGFPKQVDLYSGTDERAILASFTKNKLKETDQKSTTQNYGHPWADHWAYLLKPLIISDCTHSPYQESPYKVTQLGDDRAMIAALTQLDFSTTNDDANNQSSSHPIINLDEAAMTRLCFIDPSHNLHSSPYSRYFLQQIGKDANGQTGFEQRYCYDRFWFKEGESNVKPSRMMNCGYAYTWLGPLDDEGFFADEKSGAPKTFRTNYVPMAMMAHFQQAKLLTLMNQLSQTTKEQEWDEEKLQECQKNFIRFTQTYWFSEVTHQEQGLEMFAIWRQQLRLNVLYDEIRAQLQDVMSHVQAQQTDRLNRRIMVLTFLSLTLACAGVTTGLLGINIFDENMNKVGIQGISIFKFLVAYSVWLVPVSIALLVAYYLKPIKIWHRIKRLISH